MLSRKSITPDKIEQQQLLQDLLKEIRLEAGLRQVDLAELLGVPQSLVSKYETGERTLDIFELRNISQVLGIPFALFVQILEEKIRRENEA